MKQILGLLLCAAAFTACSKDEAPTLPQYEIISFESAEGMVDFAGNLAELGNVDITGYVPASFSNVLCAKSYMNEQDKDGNNFFDDILFKTADKKVGFGSFFTDFKSSPYGANDTWGGLALSQNFSQAASAGGPDYTKQFSAWTTTGANGSKTFAIAYMNGMGNAYDSP